jgi:hypothetical protein
MPKRSLESQFVIAHSCPGEPATDRELEMEIWFDGKTGWHPSECASENNIIVELMRKNP